MPPTPDPSRAPTIADVQEDVRRLDEMDAGAAGAEETRIVSNMPWQDLRIPVSVRTIAPGAGWMRLVARLGDSLPGRLLGLLTDLVLALRLLLASFSRRNVLLLEAEREALIFCLLSSFLRRGPAPIVLFGFYLYPYGRLKRRVIRRALGAAAMHVTWSKRQAELYGEALDMPLARFACVPFKSNHSGKPDLPPLDLGTNVFAGGNSERDYVLVFIRTGWTGGCTYTQILWSRGDSHSARGLRPGRLAAASRYVACSRAWLLSIRGCGVYHASPRLSARYACASRRRATSVLPLSPLCQPQGDSRTLIQRGSMFGDRAIRIQAQDLVNWLLD